MCVGVWGAHLEAHNIELRPIGKAKIVHLPAFQGKVGFLKSTFISSTVVLKWKLSEDISVREMLSS